MIRKVLMFICTIFIMMSCTTDLIDSTISEGVNSSVDELQSLSTTVEINGTRMAYSLSSENSQNVGNSDAYYFIRIDNRIPGCGSFDASKYYPQTSNGGTIFYCMNNYGMYDGNKGSLNKSLVSKWSKGSGNIGDYIYDTTGKKTIEPLVIVPSIQKLIDVNKGESIDLSQVNVDTLKVIWYITKYESGIWHVDGVLTGNSTKDVTEVPGIEEDESKENKKEDEKVEPTPQPEKKDTVNSIEVDIHQQEHKDWGEIKTSVHLCDTVNISHVVITIPLDSSYVIEQDDFAVRQYTYYKSYEKDSTNTIVDNEMQVSVTVTHSEKSIVYDIYCSPSFIKEKMKGDSKDGVTIEIHAYTILKDKVSKDVTKTIWDNVEKSTVDPFIGDNLHISSALFKENDGE